MNQLSSGDRGDCRGERMGTSRQSQMAFVFSTILNTDHWLVEMASVPRIICLRRTEVPLQSVEEVHEAFSHLQGVLERLPQRAWGLLFDVRNARPAHDPEIERAFQENRARYYQAFGRFGVLVRTAAGVMQVRRMLRHSPDGRISVFSDEEEALQWVRAKDSVPPQSGVE